MKKLNYIDLFAGCGGLSDGFEASNKYNILAAVEWEKKPLKTLEERLSKHYNIKNADKVCLNFDIQRTEELFNGWNDEKYGNNGGLAKIINNKKVDFIIGGPPCQAYSVAGRIRDENGMSFDYRNYLFESYIKVVSKIKPSIIVFENVPGLLSAKPNGINIVEKIREEFNRNGYEILEKLNGAIIDVSDYGVPQYRKRIIIVGLRKELFSGRNIQNILNDFYKNILPKYKSKKMTVRDAISDLPKLYPEINGNNVHYTSQDNNFIDHISRQHSIRDITIFQKLAMDKEQKLNQYNDTESIKQLYYETTGKWSNIHKYHVIDWDEPSTTIVAHLHKDGLRHIHPDPKQARSITVREAARLQSFDDSFEFFGSRSDAYKMIGNAVPPKFAKCLANGLFDFFNKYLIDLESEN